MFIQLFAEVVGFLIQIIAMSGLDDLIKLAPRVGAKFGRFKMVPKFLDDIKMLKSKVNAADDGAKVKPASFVDENPSRFGDDVSGALKRTDDVIDTSVKATDDVVDSAAKTADGVTDTAKNTDNYLDENGKSQWTKQ